MKSTASLEKSGPQASSPSLQRRTIASAGIPIKPVSQLAAEINASSRVQPLAQLRQQIDQSPLVQAQMPFGGETSTGLVIQQKALAKDKLNVAGEYHPESVKRRDKETEYTTEKTGGAYFQEGAFKSSKWALQADRLGDPFLLRAEMLMALLKEKTVPHLLTPFSQDKIPPSLARAKLPIGEVWDIFKGTLADQLNEIATALYLALDEKTEVEQAVKSEATHGRLRRLSVAVSLSVAKDAGPDILPEINGIIAGFATDVLGMNDIRLSSTVNRLRSEAMQEAAANNAQRTLGAKKGLWKVGNEHIEEIRAVKKTNDYELMTKDEFNEDFVPWVQQKYPAWFYTAVTVPAVKTAAESVGELLDKYPKNWWSVKPEDTKAVQEGLKKLKDAWNGIQDQDRKSNAGTVISVLDRYFMTVDARRPAQEAMWEEKGFTKPPK